MPIEFTVFKGSKDGIKQSTTRKEGLKRDEVLVRVTHSGVCGTDLHYQNADMALGHEGTGLVEATGPDAHILKKGDRGGKPCPERKMYAGADLDQGSFASHAVWREAFLFKIPENLASEDAGPLMCGGSTVWNALHVAQVRPTARVGIVGVGGLGHLAIQFAAKMGCAVVVFSGTDSKKQEALKLGATEFHATKGLKELKLEKPLDNLIVTTSSQPDWKMYLSVMAPGGVISPLSVDAGDLQIPYMPLLLSGLRVQGGIVSSRQVHRDMLEFAALHKIKPVKMSFPLTLEGVKESLKTLEDGKMRYRGVLVAEN
ncbi:hypothetical protein N7454_002804 [Penicillium verhagenii]|nr:hypothetical protein N7454_002804 [Penicillium verhagenii]